MRLGDRLSIGSASLNISVDRLGGLRAAYTWRSMSVINCKWHLYVLVSYTAGHGLLLPEKVNL